MDRFHFFYSKSLLQRQIFETFCDTLLALDSTEGNNFFSKGNHTTLY